MHKILTSHRPSNLPEGAAGKIAAVLKAAKAREGKMKR